MRKYSTETGRMVPARLLSTERIQWFIDNGGGNVELETELKKRQQTQSDDHEAV